MNSYSTFKMSQQNGVVEFTLCRPQELNSMSRAFWNELPQALRALEQAGDVRVLIIASTGRHFTAGMDLSVFSDGALATGNPRAREHLRQKALWLQESFNLLEKARFPVIAAIQGGCIGGGVDMVSACDIRLMTSDAFLCIQEINIGMMADLGTLQRLPRLLPEAIVRELAYTGDRLPASEAHRLGFANHLFATQDDMLAAARAMAAKIAGKPPLAIAGSKEMITFARDHDTATALNLCATWQAGMMDENEIAALMAARKQEAPPVFAPLQALPQAM